MRQLALDLLEPPPPTLDNFIAGANRECVARVRALALGERSHPFVYLWGLPGSGRSHLLAALAGSAAALCADAPIERFGYDPQRQLYAVDDVQLLDDARQQALFHLFNRVQASGQAALVCAGDRPPMGLELREDLRTRLGAGLVFELRLLSDDDKARALRAVAGERGVSLAEDVVPWLLTHHSRDIRSLLAVLDALDRRALELKRPITLALVRELFATGPGPKPRGESSPDPREPPSRSRPD